MKLYYGNVTFVIALPRSRTAWIADTFAGPADTYHDPLRTCASVVELRERLDWHIAENPLQPVVVADTAAAFFYPEIVEQFPQARFMFVYRQPDDVRASLRAAGQPDEMIDKANAHFWAALQLCERAGHLHMKIDYHALDDVTELHNMWRFIGCLRPPPDNYFNQQIARNIQVPFAEQQRLTDHGKVRKLFASRMGFL